MNTARTFEVENPATLEVLDTVADHDPVAARHAVDRVAAGFPGWSSTSPRERSEVLYRTRELMLRDKESLANFIAAENGKSLADAAAEVVYAAEFFRWFAEEGVRPSGDYRTTPDGSSRTLVTSEPIGVSALVIPWNFPAAMATRKLAPALAAGCTAVLKPAAETPLTSMAIAALLGEAGLPAGVVEVVTTTDASGVVSAWLEDARVRKLSFTGSTNVGRSLLHQAANRVVSTSMELGGNAPVIVTDDADLETAVAGTMLAKFRHGGQVCTAANRIFVHRAVAGQFVDIFGSQVEKLSVGPAVTGAQIGPLITKAAQERVQRTVEVALDEGARISHVASAPQGPGYFYPPTVLCDVAPEASILASEIFGPVAPIAVWEDEEDLLERVNSTEYGLAAYVFAGGLGRAMRLADRVEAGMVGVNRGLVSDPSAPFGGVKQSGLGREGAHEGLREFQETKYFSLGSSWTD